MNTEFTDKPICPYCGHSERNVWEIDFGGMDGDVEHTCGSCGEDYSLSRHVSVSYSSSPLIAGRTE